MDHEQAPLKVREPRPYKVLIGASTPERGEVISADINTAAIDHPLITSQTQIADSLETVISMAIEGVNGQRPDMIVIPEKSSSNDPRWSITPELLKPFLQQAVEAGILSAPLEQYFPSESDEGYRNIWYAPKLKTLGLSHAIALRLLGFRGRIILYDGSVPGDIDIVRSSLWSEYPELRGKTLIDGFVEFDKSTINYGFRDDNSYTYLPTRMSYTPDPDDGPYVEAFKTLLVCDIPIPQTPHYGLLECRPWNRRVDAPVEINQLLQKFAKLGIDPTSFELVLDAGYGEGYSLQALSQHLPNTQLIGIDAKECPARNDELSPNITLREGDINYLDLCGIKKGSVNLILMDNILDQYFGVWEDDKGSQTITDRFFTEIAQVVKTGGFVNINDPSADRIIPIMQAHGFKLIDKNGGHLYRKVV